MNSGEQCSDVIQPANNFLSCARRNCSTCDSSD